MKYIDIQGKKDGKNITISVSNLLMGSGDFLRPDNMDFAAPVLDKFIEIGGNSFDTARQYRHSEKTLASWMKLRRNRDSLVIHTKACHPTRENPDVARVTPEAIEDDLYTSLETLDTDHVELFALHRDDPTKEVGPIMESLHKQVEKGLVYAIGASNWEIARIIEANKYAAEHKLTPFTFNSPNLSLAKVNRPRWENCVSANDEMIRWHQNSNTPLLAWSSQAGGFFSGRFTPDIKDDVEMVEVYYSEANWERYRRAEELADKKKVTPIQISLAYVLCQTFPTAAVIGPENSNELLSSYDATKILLTDDEVRWLDLKE
ncbi:oxidoreductase [Oceanobacillus oncorhynchi subsp. incaldanensis]|uniref:Aldo/keto reductase n=1 Tax=Oceanobacillus aidingensis TaxID=645964 RepID=A0ABV9JTM4_9BACI|nr:aldo/keto reductase [Oceanobacillus oncorhynchi]GIO18979.1 oxidoreductase [Oceanobacillus oncorhynchi subsp. incaldanensis]